MDDRKGFIGSSEISALLGLNPFQTPLELWAIKTRNIVPPESNNEAKEWGKRLEKIVAKKFSEKNKVKLIAYKKRFVHPKYPFLTCELDNIIAGTDEMVEIKTTSLWNQKQWEKPDDVPVHYVCQVMFALGLSNRKIGHIAVLIGGQKYLEKKIIFDKELFESMVKKAVFFWQEFILKKQMPMQITARDGNIIYQLFPHSTENAIKLGDEADGLIEVIQANKTDLMALKDTISKNENELKAMIKDNSFAETARYKVSWKEQVSSRFDIDRLKEEQQEIYNRYKLESKYKVLRISERKEAVI